MVARAVAAVVVTVLLAAGCGSGSDQTSQQEAKDEAAQAAQDALDEERAREAEEEAQELQDELDELREQLETQQDAGGGGGDTGGGNTGGGNTGGGADAAAGLSFCDANVAVNSVTSCPFAYNVVETIQVEGLVFEAWSPTTEQWYSMSCVDFGDAVECTGGNDARVVWIP